MVAKSLYINLQNQIFASHFVCFMPDDILALTLRSRGELSREKYVGQFALYVGLHGMIAFLTVQVLKVNLSHVVGQRGDINHSGRS